MIRLRTPQHEAAEGTVAWSVSSTCTAAKLRETAPFERGLRMALAARYTVHSTLTGRKRQTS